MLENNYGYWLICNNMSLPVTVIDAVDVGLDFDALLSSGCTDSKFVSVISGRTKHCSKPCIKSEIMYIKTRSLEFYCAMHFILFQDLVQSKCYLLGILISPLIEELTIRPVKLFEPYFQTLSFHLRQW